MQFPLIPCTRTLQLPSTVNFRPNNEILEFITPIVHNEVFDDSAPKEQAINEISI